MSHIKIEELEDSYHCEDCGTSYATGYRVYKDGKVIVERLPVAHCYDGDSFEMSHCLEDVLEALGHTVEMI